MRFREGLVGCSRSCDNLSERLIYKRTMFLVSLRIMKDKVWHLLYTCTVYIVKQKLPCTIETLTVHRIKVSMVKIKCEALTKCRHLNQNFAQF